MLPSHLVQSILESAPDAMIVADACGCIVFANHQAVALFGYELQELVGSPLELLLPEPLRGKHVGHREAFAHTPRTRPMGAGLELAARRKDGSELPVEISLSPIADGGTMFAAATIRDVTARKRIEAELRAAREAADRANQAKSRFLATASHDLRQPLQTLSLLNGTLQRLSKVPVASEALARQEQAITAMMRLVNALLDVSKLESGTIRPEITDFTVASLFDELRQEFTALALTKGLKLEVETCHDSIQSDPALVEQILRNLVSNAIKYTRRGRVLLRCSHQSDSVRLEVLDTGIGISADQVPHIFEEFYQVGTEPHATRQGYGLGLSIVSRLVSLLGLTLDVQSELGKGSTFRLDVPSSRATANRENAVPSAMNGQHERSRVAPRVLLVEDDVGVRDATRMLLRAEGYEVLTAASGAEALQRLEDRSHIDLLIADYQLGEETGMQVIAAARKRVGAVVRAVLVTGDTSPLVRALELEREDRLSVLTKPIQAERLLALVSELIARE